MAKEVSILKAAWLVAIVTIVSKLVGFIRDVVIAKYFGTGVVSDAYFYAYQIPAIAILILGGVGGPFHSATVAIFSKIIPSFDEKAPLIAVNLFRTFTTLSFIFFVVFAILTFTFSDVIMQFIINSTNPELVALASMHLKIMSPILVLGGIIGIYYGLLVTYNEFLLPNISPLIMSVVIIAALVLSKNDSSGYVLATATTVGAFCQLLVQMPKIRKLGYTLKPRFDFVKNIQLKHLGELLFPAILSSSVGQVHIYVDMFFASQLQTGAWTAISYANRLYQFPLGVLVTAFLVPLFPLFSKLVAAKQYDDIKYYFNKGIGTLNFIAFPIIVLIFLCGYDAVQIVFQRGAFDAHATALVSEALYFLSVGLIPYVFRDSITRVFYSFNDSATPFAIAVLSILFKVGLNYLFISVLDYDIGGITLSTSLVTLINAILLGSLIIRKIKLDYLLFFKNILKMAIAAVLTYLILLPVNNLMHFNCSFFITIKLLIMTVLCFFFYTVFSFFLKLEYPKLLLNRLTAKLK